MNKQVPDFKKLAQDIARKFDPAYDARLLRMGIFDSHKEEGK